MTASAASPESVAALVRDGDDILMDTSRPKAVGLALAERTDLRDVDVYAFGVAYTDSTPLDALATTPGVTVHLSMTTPGLRRLAAEGTVRYHPTTLFAAARHPPIELSGRTFALFQTPPLADGAEQPLGTLTAYGRALAALADIVVVETNAQIPRVAEGQTVPRSAIDYVVDVGGTEPPVLTEATVTRVEEAIARNVVAALPDRPTVQLGIGSIYPAVARELVDVDVRRVWTGLISNGVDRLMENDDVAVVTGCSALGTDRAFYRWLEEEASSAVELRSVTETHNPANLHRQRNFAAVNSAFQVDLTGQVNAEMIDRAQLSGVGGQADFMHVARSDPDGRAVIALSARAPNDQPKIVPSLSSNVVVTTPRHCVDAVVTEYGTAHLSRKSTRKRAHALIEIAHPDDRGDLESAAEKLDLL